MSKTETIAAPRLALVLVRCTHVVTQIAEDSIRETGLCLTDFVALEVLLHKGPMTITDIQEKVQLASGSMTAAVDRLEQKGLIVRKPAGHDRRAKLLELTAAGRRTVTKAFGHHAAVLESAMVVLNDAERKQLHALLKKLGLFARDKRHSQ